MSSQDLRSPRHLAVSGNIPTGLYRALGEPVRGLGRLGLRLLPWLLVLTAIVLAGRAGASPGRRAAAQVELSGTAVHLPFDLDEGHVLVETWLDGEGPFRFQLDTGAGVEACLDTELAERLGLQSVGTAWHDDGSGRDPVRRSLVALQELRVGGLRAENVTALVADLHWLGRPGAEPVDGVLGFDLFHDVLLTIDYPARRIELARGELSSEEAHVIDYDDSRGLPDVELRLAGRRIRALIDTGARSALSLPDRWRRSLPLRDEPSLVGTVRTVNNEFQLLAARLRSPLEVAGYRLRDVAASFAVGDDEVLVGGGLLRHFRLTVDQVNRRLRLLHDGERESKLRDRVASR
ncbi:MAG: aspartyl protease family protein [Acidobacteriota bacterium]